MMSDYKMDIMGDIGLTEYSNIHDYLGIVESQDNFTITLNTENMNDVNMISSMLKDNSFQIYEEGYDKKGNYYINARKKI